LEPDWPVPYPKPSFLFPIEVPGTDPDATPTKSIEVACAWLPFIRGALFQLVQQATWATDDPAVLLLAQQRAMTLISLFEECSSSELPFACPFDFTGADDQGWELFPNTGGFTPDTRGSLVLGDGWENTNETYAGTRHVSGVAINRTFTATTITGVDVNWRLVKGDMDQAGSNTNIVLLRLAGSVVASNSVTCSSDPDGADKHLTLSGSWTADEVIFACYSCVTANDPIFNPGTVSVFSVGVEGIGAGIC